MMMFKHGKTPNQSRRAAAKVVTRRQANAIARLASAMLVAVLAGSLAKAEVSEDISKYLLAEPAKKKALVIGVSNYRFLDQLPAVDKDKAAAELELKNLGFHVAVAQAFDRDSLLNSIDSFQQILEEGDVALFYYSGHGFHSGIRNFLTAKETPKCLPDGEDWKNYSIPVDYVLRKLEQRHVHVSILILDACRTQAFQCENTSEAAMSFDLLYGGPATRYSPNFEVSSEISASGFSPFQSMRSAAPRWLQSTYIGLAVKPGLPAYTQPDPENGSYFTDCFVSYLDQEDEQFSNTFKAVNSCVQYKSSQRQRPWLEDGSLGALYLNPSHETQEELRRLWEVTLKASAGAASPDGVPDVKAVRDFHNQFLATDYSAAARLWLRDYASSIRLRFETYKRNALEIGTPAFQPDFGLVRGIQDPLWKIDFGANESGAEYSFPTIDPLAPGEFDEDLWPAPVTVPDIANKIDLQSAQKIEEMFELNFSGSNHVEQFEDFATSDDIQVISINGESVEDKSLSEAFRESESFSGGDTQRALDMWATIRISPISSAEDLKTARILGFQRSLEIRLQLKREGLSPENITVEFPKNYALTEEAAEHGDLIQIERLTQENE